MVNAIVKKEESVLEQVTGICLQKELAYRIEEKDYWAIKGKQYALCQEAEQKSDERKIIDTYIIMKENTKEIFYIRYYKKEKVAYLQKKQISNRGSYEISVPLTKKEYKSIRNKNISWMKNSDEALVLEFYAKCNLFSWDLGIKVEYKREKINVPQNYGELYIYSNIVVKRDNKEMEQYINELGTILELKYQHELSIELRNMLQTRKEIALYWYEDYNQRKKSGFGIAGISGMLYNMFVNTPALA